MRAFSFSDSGGGEKIDPTTVNIIAEHGVTGLLFVIIGALLSGRVVVMKVTYDQVVQDRDEWKARALKQMELLELVVQGSAQIVRSAQKDEPS